MSIRFRAMSVRGFVILVAAILVGFSSLSASRAAFTDTTDNVGNNFAAGTVTIEDDDAGSVLFNVPNLAPGDVVENCIEVTYTGTLDADVRLYAANLATTTASNLAPQLNVTIEEGAGAAFVATEDGTGTGDCTGFVAASTLSGATDTLASFAGASTSFGTGLSAWAPAGGSNETKVYRFTVELDAATTDAFQGMDAQIDFVWEAQNS